MLIILRCHVLKLGMSGISCKSEEISYLWHTKRYMQRCWLNYSQPEINWYQPVGDRIRNAYVTPETVEHTKELTYIM